LYNYLLFHTNKESDAPSGSAVVAEAKAAIEATKSIIVAVGIAEDITGLKVKLPIIIQEDSQGAIRASEDYCKYTTSRKMRHETQKFNMLMYHRNHGLIDFQYVPTSRQTADFGTKQQPPTTMWRFIPTIFEKAKV